MIALVIIILAALCCIESWAIVNLCGQRFNLQERVESLEIVNKHQESAYQSALARVAELEKPTMTAVKIVREAPARRLKLRKSLSEQVQDEADMYRKQERKHEQIVENMETLGMRDAALRKKD